MTGFGKAIAELPYKKIDVEIRGLNSKQLDLNIHIPTVFRDKEVEIRNLLFQTIERGKIDFVINLKNSKTKIFHQINKNLVEHYFFQIKNIVENLNISLPVECFSSIFSLPGVIETTFCEITEIEWKIIKQAIKKALKAFSIFRMQEGKMMSTIFKKKIKKIDCFLHDIDKYESERIEKIKTKLFKSFKQLGILSYDENRFEQESIYYIERLDINEEKMRLKNHLRYFLETVKKENNQGRKLGFILQEIGREINTLGSKSNHFEMQKIVVQMKDELEQIKEHLLNVL